MTKPATTFGVAEEVAIASAGDNRACSNGRSREDDHGNGNPSTEGKVPSKKPICYGCRQKRESELLCMWRLWIYGKVL